MPFNYIKLDPNDSMKSRVDVLRKMSFEFAKEFAWLIWGGLILAGWAWLGDYGGKVATRFVTDLFSADFLVLFSAIFAVIFTLGCFLGDARRIFNNSIKELKIEYLKKLAGIYGGALGLVLPLVMRFSISDSLIVVLMMIGLPVVLWFCYFLVGTTPKHERILGCLMFVILCIFFYYTAHYGFEGYYRLIVWLCAVSIAGMSLVALAIWGFRKYRSK